MLLTAAADINVTGTPWAIEIFDQSTQTLVGACSQASSCQVAFGASAGIHTFIAYAAAPSSTIPVAGIRSTSNSLDVRWLGVKLAASYPSIVGPGQAVTLTATSAVEVSSIGYLIELRDATTGELLTFCSRGNACSAALAEPDAGAHSIVAILTPIDTVHASQPVEVRSDPIAATWLSVALSSTTTYPEQGGTTWLAASANADLSLTPWAIYIYTSLGQLVGGPCQSATCNAKVSVPTHGRPSFFAEIARDVQTNAEPGSFADSSVRTDIQVRSAIFNPVRILWGVDSCASFTEDYGQGALLPQVISRLGVPDFWARYLPTTGSCAALSADEITAARSLHMGILPIYNDYDCSAVSGYPAGAAYGAAAEQIAQADQIPLGTGIAIDIEPPGDQCPGSGNVDAAFVTGWYDAISAGGYTPVYYGNTTPGSAFGQAWCAAVAQLPGIASSSYLWSFEPNLPGFFAKRYAPAFAPYYSGCGGHYDAWQYQISDGSTPIVDQDELTNQFPLWYP